MLATPITPLRGRADFVAHVGQELRLGPVRRFGCVAGRGQGADGVFGLLVGAQALVGEFGHVGGAAFVFLEGAHQQVERGPYAQIPSLLDHDESAQQGADRGLHGLGEEGAERRLGVNDDRGLVHDHEHRARREQRAAVGGAHLEEEGVAFDKADRPAGFIDHRDRQRVRLLFEARINLGPQRLRRRRFEPSGDLADHAGLRD
ncbi:MAG: hypothetical protein WDM85_17070 [Caulobacteraceae bacterium]